MQNSTPSRRSRSPDELDVGQSKRRRTALSCQDCRRRKLKCDREHPSCGRCRKAGLATSCVYDRSLFRKPGEAPSPTGSEDVGFGVTEVLEAPPHGNLRTFAHLEMNSKDSQRGHWLAGTKSEQRTYREVAEQNETMVFRGGGFMTQLYGASYPTSQLARFPELRSFMKDAIIHDSSVARVRTDLKTLEVKRNKQRASIISATDADLLNLVPQKENTTHLVHLYLESFETIYRVLHIPSFWKDYNDFWENLGTNRSDFAAILLLILATASCVSSNLPSSYLGGSSAERDTAIMYVKACESWLGRQSRKNLSLANFQVRCLLVLAKQINTIKKKEIWESASALLRFGMATGLHRDPSLSRTSVFEQEMRRRLWATVVELDVQASIERGMPAASFGVASDCVPPVNINDEELNVDSQKAPTSKSLETYTATSFLHIAEKSRSLRVSLNSLINDPASRLQYVDVMLHDEKIRGLVDAIPSWSMIVGSQQRPITSSLMARALLEIQLQQLLILLHSPFATQSGSGFGYSRWSVISAASTILHLHHRLVMSDDFLLSLLRPSLLELIEQALLMLEDKVLRLGSLYSQYWFCAAAFGYIQSISSPDKLTTRKQQVITRVSRLYYKVLASQVRPVDTNAVSDTVTSLPNPETPWMPINIGNNASEAIGPETETQFDGLDLEDLSGWTLDNFWTFDDIDL